MFIDKNKSLKAHLFVCTNTKESGGGCAPSGGKIICQSLKEIAKNRKDQWQNQVRINASGCLGRCSEGPVAVLYPSGQWYTKLSPDSNTEILAAIESSLKE